MQKDRVALKRAVTAPPVDTSHIKSTVVIAQQQVTRVARVFRNTDRNDEQPRQTPHSAVWFAPPPLKMPKRRRQRTANFGKCIHRRGWAPL